MCDSEMLREYGLLGAFDTMINMMGEQIALITGPGCKRDPEEAALQADAEPDQEEDEVEEDEEEMEGVTYAELQFHSQALATHLFYRFGVRSGDRVLLGTSGSTAAEVVAMIACMRLNATFVPLDVDAILAAEQAGQFLNTGKGRLQNIIAECSPAAAILVAADDSSPSVRLLASLGVFRCALIRLSGSLVEDDATLTTPLIDTLVDATSSVPSPHPDPSLYVLFTSGSTGLPKGVLGTHQGLISRLAWQHDHFPFSPEEVCLRRTPLTFVDSLAEIFAPLLAGIPQCVYLMDKLNTEGVASIASEAQSLGVSRLTLLPSLLYQACHLHPSLPTEWTSLRAIIVSGEDCPLALVTLFRSLFPRDCQLINLYGSTEVAGDVTWSLLSPVVNDGEENGEGEGEEVVPIGHPLEGNFLFLVDTDRHETGETDETRPGDDDSNDAFRFLSTLSETGAMLPLSSLSEAAPVGELLVIGEHVARGYLPESYNANRFVPNPFLAALDATHSASTLPSLPPAYREQVLRYPLAYRTGDYVELHRRGLLYRGRRDRQVKIHGQRVELDEAERILRESLNVAEGVAVLSLDKEASHPLHVVVLLEKEMALRALSAQSTSLSPAALRSFLLSRLSSPSQSTSTTSTTSKEGSKAGKRHWIHSLVAMAWTSLVPQEALPRTSSYKLDRRRLLYDLQHALGLSSSSATEGELSTAASPPPSSSEAEERDGDEDISLSSLSEEEAHRLRLLEQDILDVYAMVLPTSCPSSSASFFSRGGDSMTAMEALWRLRRKLSPSLPIDRLQAVHLAWSTRRLAGFLLRAPPLSTEELPAPLSTPIVEERDVALPATKKPRISPHADSSSSLPDWKCLAAYTRGQSPPRSLSSSSDRLTACWQVRMDKCVDASPLVCLVQPSSSSSSRETDDSDLQVWVVIASHGGDVHCLRSLGASYETVWRQDVQQHVESGLTCHAALGRVFLSTYQAREISETDPSPSLPSSPGSLYALDLFTGQVVWRAASSSQCKASAMVSMRWNIVYQGDSGGLLSAYQTETGDLVAQLQVSGGLSASPVLSVEEDWLAVVSLQGDVLLLAIDDQTMQPTFHLALDCPLFSSPLFLPCPIEGKEEKEEGVRLLCAGIDGCLRCLVGREGRDAEDEDADALIDSSADIPHPSQLVVVWEVFCGQGPFFSSPCLLPDRSRAVVGCHDGKIRLVQVSSGDILAQVSLFTALYASPMFVPSLDEGEEGEGAGKAMGKVVCATTAGEVVVLEVGGVSEMSVLQVLRTMRLPAEIFSSPVVYGSSIYIGCRDDHLYCLSL